MFLDCEGFNIPAPARMTRWWKGVWQMYIVAQCLGFRLPVPEMWAAPDLTSSTEIPETQAQHLLLKVIYTDFT